MRKYIAVLFCVFFSYSAVARTGYTINEAWRFVRADRPGCETTVSFPHTWNAADAVDETPGYYRGKGTYSRDIFIGSEARGKHIAVCFGGANQVTELHVNGHFAGSHKGGYTRFAFDVTPYVEPGAENKFVITVDNSHDPDIPPLSADFTFFGGVYRDVSLLFTDPVRISPYDFASGGVYIRTPKVNEREAAVSASTVISNGSASRRKIRVVQSVVSPQNRIVAQTSATVTLGAGENRTVESKTMKITAPELWSPSSPSLYTLRTVLADDRTGETLDAVDETFGLRWFEFDAEKGFYINGQPLKLIGTNRHQCRENEGNALTDKQHVQDIRLLKEMGGNFLRISHYPQDPLILEMCDKLGIVATVETPIVNAVTESGEFLDNSLYMAEEMVKQNFNHPSLVAWGYMNEIMLRPPFTGDAVRHEKYCREVERQAAAIDTLIRRLDPSRYTMMAFHGSMEANEEAGLIKIPQLVGWNLYQGWYGGSLEGFDRFVDDFHRRYPDKPVIISEYGADVDPRLHSFSPQRFDYTAEYADIFHEHYLRAIKERPFIAGANVWNLNDFHSEVRGNAVPNINLKGITSLNREKKNTYLLYQANLLTRPFVAIGGSGWTNRAGAGEGSCIQRVKLYSNFDSVSLTHNGKHIGDFAVSGGVAEADVPFVAGENLLCAAAGEGENAAMDFYKCHFELIPLRPSAATFTELNVMLGSARYFEERVSDVCWIPEQPYADGGWGYVGGEPVHARTSFGILPAYTYDILGTSLDPLFQTQRIGIDSFRADVPDGVYAVHFYWAHLIPEEKKAGLAYNLGADAIIEELADSYAFDVEVNGVAAIRELNIPQLAGAERAVIKTIYVTACDNSGIRINFKSVKPDGKAYLNAIRILKLN